MSDLDKLRTPKPRAWTIGIKEYEMVPVWPFSMADQLKMGDKIDTMVADIVGSDSFDSDLALIMLVYNFVKVNLVEVIQMATGLTFRQAEKALEKITNDQVIELGKLIYELNFAGIAKNAESLLGGVLSLMRRPLPTSVSDTPSTISTPFSDELSSTEA